MGVTPHWMVVALTMLATYRVTRFVTRDQLPIVARPRRWLDKHWNPLPDQDAWESYLAAPPAAKKIFLENLAQVTGVRSRPTGWKRSIAYLVGCSWCSSIWVAAGIVVFDHFFLGLTWQWAALLWLASSAVTGMIAQREPE